MPNITLKTTEKTLIRAIGDDGQGNVAPVTDVVFVSDNPAIVEIQPSGSAGTAFAVAKSVGSTGVIANGKNAAGNGITSPAPVQVTVVVGDAVKLTLFADPPTLK